MSYRVLNAADAAWRPSNPMHVQNTDLARQLGTEQFGARLWRFAPGESGTRHRHVVQHELYVLLEGTGRIRVGDDQLTLDPLSAFVVEPETVRQVFNDTAADALWLVMGAPMEVANTPELTPEMKTLLMPDGPGALPPELA